MLQKYTKNMQLKQIQHNKVVCYVWIIREIVMLKCYTLHKKL